METDWQAVEYLHDNHLQVFVGIGIPYNKDRISLEEIAEIGLKKQSFGIYRFCGDCPTTYLL